MFHPLHLQCLPPALQRTVGYPARRVEPTQLTEAQLERAAGKEGMAVLLLRAYAGQRIKGRRQV